MQSISEEIIFYGLVQNNQYALNWKLLSATHIITRIQAQRHLAMTVKGHVKKSCQFEIGAGSSSLGRETVVRLDSQCKL